MVKCNHLLMISGVGFEDRTLLAGECWRVHTGFLDPEGRESFDPIWLTWSCPEPAFGGSCWFGYFVGMGHVHFGGPMVLDVRFLTTKVHPHLTLFSPNLFFSCFLDYGCFSCILYCFYILHAFFWLSVYLFSSVLYFSSNHFVVIMVISASMRH